MIFWYHKMCSVSSLHLQSLLTLHNYCTYICIRNYIENAAKPWENPLCNVRELNCVYMNVIIFSVLECGFSTQSCKGCFKEVTQKQFLFYVVPMLVRGIFFCLSVLLQLIIMMGSLKIYAKLRFWHRFCWTWKWASVVSIGIFFLFYSK